MPATRVSMRKIKDVLRLSATGMAQRQIARAVHIGLGSVNAYLNRAAEIDLEWADACALDEAELKQRLYPATPLVNERYVVPDFGLIHQELKSKGVTRQLLWEEHLQQYPDNALKYSQFCQRYREWVAGLKRSMRQIHKAGEKLFVDYAGPTIPIVNPHTGEFRQAQVFVAVLGRPITPMPRPPGHRRSLTGWAPMSAPSPSSAASPRSSCPINSKVP